MQPPSFKGIFDDTGNPDVYNNCTVMTLAEADGMSYCMTRHWTINGRFLTQPLSGVQRCAREIVSALDDVISRGL
jgi:hypothetical protein